MRDAIQELEDAVDRIQRAWDDHNCKADEEEAHANGYDEGRADLKRKLLDDIETWKRQAAVRLQPDVLSLDAIEDWVKRT